METNYKVVERLRSRITEDRLDRLAMAVEDAACVLLVCAGVGAVYFLIFVPIHRIACG